MRSKNNWSRRNFIQMTSGGVPTLALMLQQTSAALASPVKKRDEAASNKFTPIDLSGYSTATPSDFGPREGVLKCDPHLNTIPKMSAHESYEYPPFMRPCCTNMRKYL